MIVGIKFQIRYIPQSKFLLYVSLVQEACNALDQPNDSELDHSKANVIIQNNEPHIFTQFPLLPPDFWPIDVFLKFLYAFLMI